MISAGPRSTTSFTTSFFNVSGIVATVVRGRPRGARVHHIGAVGQRAQEPRCLSRGGMRGRLDLLSVDMLAATHSYGGGSTFRRSGVQSLLFSYCAMASCRDCVMACYSWEAASHLRPCTRSLGCRERHQVGEEVARLLVELLVGLLKVEAHGRVLGDGDVGVVREELEKVCLPARDLRHLHVRDA